MKLQDGTDDSAQLCFQNVLSAYPQTHNFITKQQHGFLSGESMTTNLPEALYDWTFAMRDT
jgi:hypothetical protein